MTKKKSISFAVPLLVAFLATPAIAQEMPPDSNALQLNPPAPPAQACKPNQCDIFAKSCLAAAGTDKDAKNKCEVKYEECKKKCATGQGNFGKSLDSFDKVKASLNGEGMENGVVVDPKKRAAADRVETKSKGGANSFKKPVKKKPPMEKPVVKKPAAKK